MNYKTYEVKVFEDGYREWWLNGEWHYEDGPVIDGTNGYREWWLNEKRHREMVRLLKVQMEIVHGWLNGVNYSEEEFNIEMKKQKSSCVGKIVDIDGKKYKLTEL